MSTSIAYKIVIDLSIYQLAIIYTNNYWKKLYLHYWKWSLREPYTSLFRSSLSTEYTNYLVVFFIIN